ncbi:ATP-binding protein [Roseivirga sp.]|uniref:Dph6-related ATP pyrophosphatase n=1 Tax=Roseivirga sp. TaxID=1964215 RepID=UPI003B5249E7
MQTPLFFNWSTGKDSALALHRLQNNPDFSVEHLLTSINSHHNRVSMHGLRRELFEQQMEALRIPWSTLELPEQPSMEIYEEQMTKVLNPLLESGFQNTAFGDIFLEDLRQYREDKLAPLGINAHFPLWKEDTKLLMEEFFKLGFKAIVICVNGSLLDESFVGCDITPEWLERLPDTVDPCGENGEFHTFCYDGPIFKSSISFSVGEKVYREYDSPGGNGEKSGFWFCDLLPARNATS